MKCINKRIGCRKQFAIEFEVKPEEGTPANEWLGCLWLWVEAKPVGETDQREMLSIGFDSLVEAANASGTRTNQVLSAMPAQQAFDLVMQTIYEDNPGGEKILSLSGEDLQKFDILPARAGPFFDGWEAILIEEPPHERFLYRKKSSPVIEARWKLYTFKDTVLRAKQEFQEVAKRHII